MKGQPILAYLQQQAGAQAPWEIDPRQGRALTLDHVSEPRVSAQPTSATPGACAMPFVGDEPVCVLDVRTTWARAVGDWEVRLADYHAAVAQEAPAVDALFAAAGATRGAYLAVRDGFEGDVQGVAHNTSGTAALGAPFAATLAQVDPSNLDNGVVHLPPAVCAAAGLATRVEPPTEAPEDLLAQGLAAMGLDEKDPRAPAALATLEQRFLEAERERAAAIHIDHYVCVPINHVLAWVLRRPEYAERCGLTPRPLLAAPPDQPPVLLYYVLSDVDYRVVRTQFVEQVVPCRDTRPLSAWGLEAVPRAGGQLQLRSYVTFVRPEPLSPEQRAALFPALHPDLHEAQ
jgi:hypothetical protein